MTQGSDSKPLIERRSIDYIPANERHGRLYSQFTLWLGANLQITAIVTGALAVVLGGDVFWSLVGLLIGQITSLHWSAAQRRELFEALNLTLIECPHLAATLALKSFLPAGEEHYRILLDYERQAQGWGYPQLR